MVARITVFPVCGRRRPCAHVSRGTVSDRCAHLTAESSVPRRPAVVVVTHVRVMNVVVASAIFHVYARGIVIKEPTVVTRVNGVVPQARAPDNGVEEVVCGHKHAILPIVQDVAQVGVPVGQARAIDIAGRVEAHQIVQVDFVGIIVLLVVKIQLIRHLVRQKTCVVAGFDVRHGLQRACVQEQYQKWEKHLFHILAC